MNYQIHRYILSLCIVLGLTIPQEIKAQELVTYAENTPTLVYVLVGTSVSLLIGYWLTTRGNIKTPSETYSHVHPETYLFSPKLNKAYEALPSNQERLAFIESYWKANDPTPYSTRNERRETFIEAIDYTNEAFGEPTLPGWLTDRGHTYLLYGQPDEIQALTGRSNPTVIWSYNRPASGNNIPLILDINAGEMFVVFEDNSFYGHYQQIFSTELESELALP